MSCFVARIILLLMTFQANAFVLQDGFSDFLHDQFSNLTQFKNRLGSVQKTLALRNVMTGLLTFIAPHVESQPGFKRPFVTNCSVFFDAEIDQVACDAQFEEVHKASDSCRAEQQFPESYLTQLHKSNILQMQTVVGLDPVQHPQVMYWLYYKLSPTPSVSLTDTDDLSLTDSLSHTSSLTSTLATSESHTTSQPESISHSLSDTETWSSTQSAMASVTGSKSLSESTSKSLVSMCSSIDPYADATNQTGRYLISGDAPNSTVTDLWTGLVWEQVASNAEYVWNASAPAGSAQAYCANLTKGGYRDWRLPMVLELQSLVDYTIAGIGPAIDATIFPGTSTYKFWTSDSYASCASTICAWFIWFGTGYGGYVTADVVGPVLPVRCVRGSSVTLTRYTDESGNVLTNLSIQVKDLATGLIWQRAQASSTMSWSNTSTTGSAQWYCQNLVIGSQRVGSWRLPTAKELASLVDYTVYNPSINTTAFPETRIGYEVWSSSYAGSSYGWCGDFASGHIKNNCGIGGALLVRCVRDPKWSLLAYQDATNQTNRYFMIDNLSDAAVKDTSTNLMWEQQVTPTSMTWEDAASYCAGLVKNNYGCWRLPTPVELQSLVDYTVFSPAINTVKFSGTSSNHFWTSVPSVASAGNSWITEFNYGQVFIDMINTTNRVRCVRGNAVNPSLKYTEGSGNALTSLSIQIKDQASGLIWQRCLSCEVA